ncbi:MAG: 50S ribosomal protein L4 [Candidatus Marinimicrobia bacterium]|nr:50S ribosomal protein L4 [Candidatus Neomarinimicrobiota bacterium]|tara:strand:+ start:520 stop:1149 length:630 start_codon:yes stop_codon:yes gene_type:complete
MKIDIYNKKGKKLSRKVNLDKNIFEVEPNEHCLYLTIKSELAAKRQGTSKSKGKSEVSGTGAKPFKQKGTGRARVGRLRNPSRVHGGTAFGPSPRSYDLKINKKVKKIARISALSSKCLSGDILVLDNFNISEIKTKNVESIINSLKLSDKKIAFLCQEKDSNFYLSCRNLKNINLFRAQDVPVHQLMNASMLVLDELSVDYFNNLKNS